MATAVKKAGAAAPATSTTVYEVTSPLNHDGDVYAIGDQVELTEAQAAPLLGHTVQPFGSKPAA